MEITGIYVNANDHTIEVKTIEKSLESYYSLLDVGCIDIASRKLGGQYYDIICDDEALFKADPIVTMLDLDKQPMLFGNLFIVKFDGKEDETSITEADVDRIFKSVTVVRSEKAVYLLLKGDY